MELLHKLILLLLFLLLLLLLLEIYRKLMILFGMMVYDTNRGTWA